MAKKSDEKNTPHIMEEYLKNLIDQVLDEREIALKEGEAKQIINALIPELDALIAKRVKEHFAILADHIKQKFSDEET